MKKRITFILSLALLCALSACGGSGGASHESASSMASTDYEMPAGAPAEEAYEENGSFYSSASGGETSLAQSTVYQNNDVKLIRNASLNMEATDLDQACANLEGLVASLGGYLEYSDVYQGGYDSNSYRYASYTARVPSEQYEVFLSALSDESVCHLVSKSESTENVGQQYADIEAHLAMLRTKLERLNSLLAEAVDMTDIITLEDAITSTEYEIASYSSQQNTYDNLIGYSTFNIYIDEGRIYTPAEKPSFGSRLSSAFLEGCQDFADGLQSLLVWISGHVLWLIVLAVMVGGAVIVLRRTRRRRKAPAHQEEQNSVK